MVYMLEFPSRGNVVRSWQVELRKVMLGMKGTKKTLWRKG